MNFTLQGIRMLFGQHIVETIPKTQGSLGSGVRDGQGMGYAIIWSKAGYIYDSVQVE
jgi:hypothetical protein